MQQADDVSSYAREDRPRIHVVRSLMSYSSPREKVIDKAHVEETGRRRLLSLLNRISGENGNPSGGTTSAPVTNERICFGLTETPSQLAPVKQNPLSVRAIILWVEFKPTTLF